MIKITVKEKALDLPEGFSLDIEESSPIFNDSGSQSIAVELPATVRNRRIFGFPARPDAINTGRVRGVRCIVSSGAYIRTGTINVDSASQEAISINIGFDNSIAYEAWKSKPLSKVEALPCYRIKDLSAFTAFLELLYLDGSPKNDGLAIFPICLARNEFGDDEKKKEYHEILNEMPSGSTAISSAYRERSIDRVISGELTRVFVPEGYGWSPFVKVWKILECVFADLGLTLDRNPFREDIELARLVVLNNTMDTLCNRTLDYAELMPDCTVDEFLQALYARFGMVWRADFDSGRVDVRMLREIATDSECAGLDRYLSAAPESEYMTPRYVRLSAGTSLEGAAPLNDRLEDFLKDCGRRDIYVVVDKNLWKTGDPVDGFVTPLRGEAASGVSAGSRAGGMGSAAGDIGDYCVPISRGGSRETAGNTLAWNPTSGKWFDTGALLLFSMERSTSFFSWDPAPEGYEPLDIESPDECCPIDNIDGVAMPSMLTGTRHYHTAVERDTEEEQGECPLSFMFAMTGMNGGVGTVGRLGADGNLREPAPTFSDGSTHDLSLFFHFRNGLYAKFWRDYDMMLRNADRMVSLGGMMPSVVLRTLDTLKPVETAGVRMLIDTADISVGGSSDGEFRMTLMPLMRHPDADCAPFSNEVPGFPPVSGVL